MAIHERMTRCHHDHMLNKQHHPSLVTMRLAFLTLLTLLVLTILSDCTAVASHGRNRDAFFRLHKNANATNIKREGVNQSSATKKEMICKDGICRPRGGACFEDDYDDEYYDDDDEEEELFPPPKKSSRSKSRRISSQSRRQPPPSRRGPPPSRSRRGPPPHRRGPPSPYHRGRPSRQPSLLNSAAGLAKKTASLTTTAAVGTLKGSGKAAFYLVSPKHVTRREVWGVWRLDQQVGTDSDTPISCAANVEFTPRGEVVVKYKDETYETTYLFRERSWPQSCTIEFEARAFQGPHDEEPVLMKYKGYFRRKMADSRVIKIVGHIYEVPRKGMWRKGRTGRKIGSFVARRRLTKKETRRVEIEYDDDEYDFEEDWEESDVEDEEEGEFDEKEYDEYDE